MNEFSEVANLDQSLSVEVARPSSYSFLNDLSISEDVKRRLSLHLDRVVSGSNEVFLSPIGKNNDPERLSELLLAMLNKSTVINSVLMQMEISNLDKFGPRSIAKPWVDRRDSVLNYYSNRSGPSFELDYRKLNLRPISVINGIKLLKNNTNSGLPYYTRKSRVKDRVSRDFSSLIESDYPCILFTRTQEGNKTRNVWGYPIATTLNESLFYSPLLNYQRKLIWRSALIGPSAVDREVMRMVSQSVVTDKVLLSIDFSAYDASVSNELISCSFDYIKNLFQPNFHHDLDIIRNTFNNIGLITPDGILNGPHGVPSGSTFTNEVDSLAQYIVSKSIGIADENIQIQGDDGSYSLSSKDLSSLMDTFKRAGLLVNDDKSYINDSYLIYLQKLYHIDYLKKGLVGGIYPLFRALNRIIYQERYSDFEDYDMPGIDYYSLRTISILENCKYHPLFKEFVSFIYHLDKYKLSYSKSSVSKYIGMSSNGSGPGINIINQHGEDLNGIDNFESVKIIREISKV